MKRTLHVAGEPLALRLAQPADLAELHAACYVDNRLDAFARRFRSALHRQKQRRTLWLLLEQNGSTVAAVQLNLWHRAEIANLAVAPALRGRGIGSTLIGQCCRLAAAAGWERIEIGVTVDNVRALALYRRCGFELERRLTLPGGGAALILTRKTANVGEDRQKGDDVDEA